MKKDYLKYLIFAAVILCIPLFIDEVYAISLPTVTIGSCHFDEYGSSLGDGVNGYFRGSCTAGSRFSLHYFDVSFAGPYNLHGKSMITSVVAVDGSNYSISTDGYVHYDNYSYSNFSKNTLPWMGGVTLPFSKGNYSVSSGIIDTGGGSISTNFYVIPSLVFNFDKDSTFAFMVHIDFYEDGRNSDSILQSAYQSANDKLLGGKLDDVNQSIKDQINATNKVDGTLNSIKDADISADSKEKPDDTALKDYETAEGELLDKVGEADMDAIDIGIDVDSSSWVWDTTTKLIKSHPAVFGMVISILSIGIIKLALGR